MSDLEATGKGDRRGYSWPPFEPGNDAAVLHGAKSPERVDPIAKACVEWALETQHLDYLREERFAPAVHAWARVEAQRHLVGQWVASMPVEEAASPRRKGAQTSPLELLRQFEQTAATHRARLGLDPMSAAKLQRELVEMSATARYAGLDQVREQGRAARARRLQPIDASTDDDQGGDAA